MVLLGLCGCAAIAEDVRATRCHWDGAFEAGMNDGRTGKEMSSSSFMDYCDPDARTELRAGYRDGYQAGLASRARELPVVVRTGDRAYHCRLEVFGSTYEDFGATELEARTAAEARCREKESGTFFCSGAVCSRNE